MKGILKNKQFTKFLPIYFIILSMVILLGTSYALLRSSITSTNAYTMNVGILNVNFFGTTDSISIQNMVPMTDEEGLAQTGTGNILNFTIKNTGGIRALYDVYIEETSSSSNNPSFKSVIRYSVNKKDAGYGEPLGLNDNMLYIEKNGVIDIGETINYKVKFWLGENADITYMNKTFTAKVVISSRQIGLVNADNVSFTPVDESTCEGDVPCNDVQLMLEKIAGMVGIEKVEKISSCPDCEFMYTTNQYQYGASGTTRTKIVDTDGVTLSSNYNDVITETRKWFLGVKFNGDKVEKAYACGVENDIPFCIEGYTDGSKQSANIDVLTGSTPPIYSSCSGSLGSSFGCSGSVGASTYSDGRVFVRGDSDYCLVTDDGSFGCGE